MECRDAVLDWSTIEHDPERDEPDLTQRLRHPVTGRLVPDPRAKHPYIVHHDPVRAPWPQADFIVGNPPYLGGTEMRETLGSGYVDALREAYAGDLPEGADYVMFWWARAAAEIASGRAQRAGLITTNSITNQRNRAVVEAAAESGAGVTWAVADHPWVDEVDGAAVRVAMTVLAREPTSARLVRVDETARVVGEARVPSLNADLSAAADVPETASVPLHANSGLSSNGYNLRGAGFIVDATEARGLLDADPKNCEVLRPYVNGRDLASRPRGVYLIDFNRAGEDCAGRTINLHRHLPANAQVRPWAT